VTLSAGKLSAKKIIKARKLPITATASAEVTRVQVLLVRGAKPGGKIFAKATAAKLNGKVKLSLKVKGKPKAGKHTLVFSAVDAQGRRVGATKAVTLKK
jgi:hypothetical protein